MAKNKKKSIGHKSNKSKPEGEKFEMPKWMECTWRRLSCGKDDCPICGRIKKDRQRHIEKGEDPDDLKCVFEDVGRNFKEVLTMIKQDYESKGIELSNIDNIQEPPEPEEFPLYKKVKDWRESVFDIIKKADYNEEFWLNTEKAQDLVWYSNLLIGKVYRQLCNRWHIDEGDEYGEFDYEYTQGIIKESIEILEKTLAELTPVSCNQKSDLLITAAALMNLKKQLLKI